MNRTGQRIFIYSYLTWFLGFLSLGFFPLLPIRYRINRPGPLEPTQPQCAAIALAAGKVFTLVARPGQVEWGIVLQAGLHDLGFRFGDHGSEDADVRLRLRSQIDRPLERIIEDLTAVWIAA